MEEAGDTMDPVRPRIHFLTTTGSSDKYFLFFSRLSSVTGVDNWSILCRDRCLRLLICPLPQVEDEEAEEEEEEEEANEEEEAAEETEEAEATEEAAEETTGEPL